MDKPNCSILTKTLLVCILLFAVFLQTSAQRISIDNPRGRDWTGFRSIFKNTVKGDFSGTLSGVMYLQKGDSAVTVINFCNEKSLLHIEPDPYEIYEVSRKHYLFKRGGMHIRYTTYGWANCFELKIDNDTFSCDLIEGGCDLVIDGLEWSYATEDYSERLYLSVYKDFGLWRKKGQSLSDYQVKAGSVFCFKISRKPK
ncbi:MAG: hypothetical protein LBR64_05985 [Dysgonamonadaceae bacterium]|nr:hypothetical protein [Dysgonamonadaceae bacterium]